MSLDKPGSLAIDLQWQDLETVSGFVVDSFAMLNALRHIYAQSLAGKYAPSIILSPSLSKTQPIYYYFS